MENLELKNLIREENYTDGGGEINFEVTVEIDPNLKAFDGHFPDRPILPGVVQIEILREILEKILKKNLNILEIQRARMSQMLLPRDRVVFKGRVTTMESSENSEGIFHCKAQILKGGKRASSLQVKFAAP